MEVRYSSHSVYKTIYHIVMTTKFRRKVLNPGFGKYAKEVIESVVKEMEGVEIEEINVQVDHVHMIMIIPPKYAVSSVIGVIKSRSAKEIRKRFDWMDKVYWGTRSMWSGGYFVSTVGLNEEVIMSYVKYQRSEDSGQAKLEI